MVRPYLGPHSRCHLPFLGGDQKECQSQPGRVAGPHLVLFTRVLAFLPRSPEDSGLNRLLPSCKYLARLWVPLPPSRAPARNVSELCSRALGTQSARPACSVHSPSWTSGLKKRHQRDRAPWVLTSSELKVLHAMESGPWLLRLFLRIITMVRTSGVGLCPRVGTSHLVGQTWQR